MHHNSKKALSTQQGRVLTFPINNDQISEMNGVGTIIRQLNKHVD